MNRAPNKGVVPKKFSSTYSRAEREKRNVSTNKEIFWYRTLACFLSGLAFGIVAYFIAPESEWMLCMATVAGLLTGYLTYDLRTTFFAGLRAINVAMTQVIGPIWTGTRQCAEDMAAQRREFNSKPHPIGTVATTLSAIATIAMVNEIAGGVVGTDSFSGGLLVLALD